MARPQAADFEQRRLAIVERAAELFAQRGFAGASIADLAVACETSKSLVYHYFASKEAILYEVMASHIDQLVHDADEVTEDDGAPCVRFSKLIHAFMHHYVGAAARQKVLLNELDKLPPDNQAAIISQQRHVVRSVQSILEAMYPALQRDPGRARAHTMLVFGMINWTHTWYNPRGPVNVDDLADIVVGMACPGR